MQNVCQFVSSIPAYARKGILWHIVNGGDRKKLLDCLRNNPDLVGEWIKNNLRELITIEIIRYDRDIHIESVEDEAQLLLKNLLQMLECNTDNQAN